MGIINQWDKKFYKKFHYHKCFDKVMSSEDFDFMIFTYLGTIIYLKHSKNHKNRNSRY